MGWGSVPLPPKHRRKEEAPGRRPLQHLSRALKFFYHLGSQAPALREHGGHNNQKRRLLTCPSAQHVCRAHSQSTQLLSAPSGHPQLGLPQPRSQGILSRALEQSCCTESHFTDGETEALSRDTFLGMKLELSPHAIVTGNTNPEASVPGVLGDVPDGL